MGDEEKFNDLLERVETLKAELSSVKDALSSIDDNSRDAVSSDDGIKEALLEGVAKITGAMRPLLDSINEKLGVKAEKPARVCCDYDEDDDDDDDDDLEIDIREAIVEHPIASVAIAAGIGFFAARLLSSLFGPRR
ncbi:hypothetical protein FACS1894216_19990 [Synergistales bacterium]|nr:hypothetical protein FACS1894216_19990 [Synergistales bacterium]